MMVSSVPRSSGGRNCANPALFTFVSSQAYQRNRVFSASLELIAIATETR